MEWNQEQMRASIERAVEAARRLVRDQGAVNGMLATLYPINDSTPTVLGLAMPDKPEDRDLLADVIRGIADELDAIMVTLAVSAQVLMPSELDIMDLSQSSSDHQEYGEVLMVTASHRLLGDSSHFERIRRDGDSVKFDVITEPLGIDIEDRFAHLLSPQREPISTAAREQAREIAARVRLSLAGNGDEQPRH